MFKNKLLYLKQNLIKLFNLGFLNIVSSTIICKILSFSSGLFLVRIIPKNEYGIYSYSNNILSFFILFSGFGVTSAVLQLCSESIDYKTKQAYYSLGFTFGLLFNFILGLIIIIFSFLITLPINGSNYYLLLMCFIPLVHIVSELELIYLRTEIKNFEYSVSNVICSLTMLIFVLVLSLYFKVNGLIMAQYFSYIVSAVIIFLIFKIKLSFTFKNIFLVDIKSFFSICTISVLNNGLSKLMYLLDIFVLGLVAKNDNYIASYKVATNIPTALLFIPSSIIIFIYPYFAKNKDNKNWLFDNYFKIIVSFGIFNLILTFILLIFSNNIIIMLFGNQYNDAVPIFRVLCISYFFSSTFRIISGNLLITQRKYTFNLFLSILSSGFNTILNYFLIKHFNSIGAAYATLITVIFTSFISTLFLLITINKIQD